MVTQPVAPPNSKSASDNRPAPSPDTNPFSLKRYSSGTRKIASFGLTLFLVGLLVAGLWAPHYWSLSILCSGAFMAIGWGIGFLFGVPRTASTDTRSNTNLEQISDWLTKVLVGVGLTQLQKIPIKLQLLAEYLSKDYGPSASPVFALSMVLYFSALVFLTGYLLTRLALQPEFAETDTGGVQVKTAPTTIKVGATGGAQVKTGVTEVEVGQSDADLINRTGSGEKGGANGTNGNQQNGEKKDGSK